MFTLIIKSMKKITADASLNNKRIFDIVRMAYPDVRTSLIYSAFDKKDIKVNGRWVKMNHKVVSGDEVVIFIDDSMQIDDNKIMPEIVYDDDNLIIVIKPSGMLVQKDDSPIEEYTLDDFVHQEYFKAIPVHRLDRNTEGLVLFAKNDESCKELIDLLNNSNIEKHYMAVVLGIMPKKSVSHIAYLFKDSKKSMVYISDVPKKGYMPIGMKYTTRGYTDGNTILQIILQTGRTHQIRAHLAHLGYPILGDGKYGKNRENTLKGQKRQLLCASSLKFNIPDDSLLHYLDGKVFSCVPTFLKNISLD